VISPVADGLLADSAGGVDPSDRWRRFAVAASATSVIGQQNVDLYVARLRTRRASPRIYPHARTAWLRDNINVNQQPDPASTAMADPGYLHRRKESIGQPQ
jgi:hypothetical protein